jgi:hypothetical protein
MNASIKEEAKQLKALKAEETKKLKALKAEETKKLKALKAEETKKLKALKAEETKKLKALKAKEAKELKAKEAKELKAKEAKQKVINRGTGAGGANTNKTGKPFEENTDNLKRMIEHGFAKQKSWLSKQFEDRTVVIVKQHGLKQYAKHKYGIDDIYRCPDEAYIIEYATGKKVIKILEKKMQNVEGSVETKLYAGPLLKRDYEMMFGPEFEIQYGFCISEFLQKNITSGTKKYNNLRKMLEEENNIPILFGNDANYFETLDSWISS